MQRALTIATLVGLLIATAAAFAITERLKLEKSPITGTRVEPSTFSPVCHCADARVTIRIKLRRADHVTVTMLDSHSHAVRVLVFGRPLARGENVFRWDGRTDAGARAVDGTYRAEIHLAGQHQTIVLPNPITLDTKPPAVVSASLSRPTFSPDDDGQADFVRIRYRVNKPAHALVYLGPYRIIGPTRSHKESGEVTWDGKFRGRTLGPGNYRISVGAVDLAGNVTPRAARKLLVATIRYIELAQNRIVVRAGKRFHVGVSTDAKRYSWKLGARSSTATGRVLALLAPKSKGVFMLTVREHGRASRARVLVR